MPIYEHPIQVEDADIDVQGHVNNVVYVRYMQDAAIAHWVSVAPADLQAEVVWVARRHEIDYLRPAMPNDSLVVKTWVGVPSGAKWERFTEIVRPSDGQVISRSRSVWVLLDRATLRPKRVDESITGRFLDGALDPVAG